MSIIVIAFKLCVPDCFCPVCVCFVCLLLRILITISIMWCDMDPSDWFKNFYNLYMTALVSIFSRWGLRSEVHHKNYLNRTKLALYKLQVCESNVMGDIHLGLSGNTAQGKAKHCIWHEIPAQVLYFSIHHKHVNRVL